MYNTTEHWKNNFYNIPQSVRIILNGEHELSNDYVQGLNLKYLINNGNVELGSVPIQNIELTIYKHDELPDVIETIQLYHQLPYESDVNGLYPSLTLYPSDTLYPSGFGEYDEIPVGQFYTQDYYSNDDFTITVEGSDILYKTETEFIASDITYPATVKTILERICKDLDIALGTDSFINQDTEVSVYDDSLTYRTVLGYISELAGGFAHIGRDGKLYIKPLFTEVDYDIDIELFKEFKWGEEYIVSRTAYEDGIREYKYGDDTNRTIWINPNNIYIIDETTIENIHNSIVGKTMYSFEGTVVIDPSIDIGDVITIDNKPVMWQYDISLYGKYIGSIENKIELEETSEAMNTVVSETTKLRRVQSTIDQVEGTITLLATEVDTNRENIGKLEVSIDSVTIEVSETLKDYSTTEQTKSLIEVSTEGILLEVDKKLELIQEVEGTTPLTISDSSNYGFSELTIYGNNTVFDHLRCSTTTITSNTTYCKGDSIVKVTNSAGISYYDLGVTDVLRQVGSVYDEYRLIDGKGSVIRRISSSGTVLTTEVIETVNDIYIKFEEGENIIEIVDYTAYIYVKYAIKNDYTDTFATKIEMNSSITQTAESIMLEVNKKIDEDEFNSRITQTAETIMLEVDKKIELLQEIEGSTPLTISDSANYGLSKLTIYGNNVVFDHLRCGQTVVTSNTTYCRGDSIVKVTNSEGEFYYDLGVTDVLRQYGDVYDEYQLIDGKGSVIRRISDSGSLLATEVIETANDVYIKLSEGKNIIEIVDYTANIYVEYAIQNDYTDILATKVEMSSSITQTSEAIMLEVNKKVDEDEFNSTITQTSEAIMLEVNQKVDENQMNSAINQSATEINLEVAKKVGNDEVISKINQTSETISINANRINLNRCSYCK